MSDNGITRPDLWEKALNTISPRPKTIVGIWEIYQMWREYWRLLKEDRDKEDEALRAELEATKDQRVPDYDPTYYKFR